MSYELENTVAKELYLSSGFIETSNMYGEGIVAILISACILGVLFSQGILITQGFYITHLTEVFTWVAGVIILMRKQKEMAIELLLSLVVGFAYQMFIPYWG